jgi:hypothetical protein
MENNPMFKKLIEKKRQEGKTISGVHAKAKSSVLADLMAELGGMGLDKIKGLKKVTVAAPDKSSLEEGLMKAKEMLKDDNMSEDESNEDSEEESHESPEEEMTEETSEDDSTETPEELEAQLEEIKAKLAKLKA